MSTSDQAPDRKRRRFLAAAGGAGALGTLAALATEHTAVAAPVAAPVADATPSGYRETEHIRKYYRSARYW